MKVIIRKLTQKHMNTNIIPQQIKLIWTFGPYINRTYEIVPPNYFKFSHLAPQVTCVVLLFVSLPICT